MKLRMPIVIVLSVLVAFTTHALGDDLASVRYQKVGTGHYYLSTHQAVPVGDREVSIGLYLLADRYVAAYSEAKRRNASESEVLVQQEITGGVSGTTLGNLGTVRVLAEKKNGKPVVELVLAQPIGSSPRGLTLKLAWTAGSWAPKSVQ
jgi:hypothetical protein